jgi:uncharacterized membrane protein
VIIGFIFIFAIPPFQKTDEISHYYKTVAVATGNFFCPNLIPKSLFDLPEKMMANFVNENPQHRFPKGAILPTLKEKYDGHPVSENISCTLPFIFYLPSALMLALPIFLKLNPLIVFYLGRLSFYLISVTLFYLSLKIIPKKFQPLLLMCLSLPMVLIQMGAFNKEVFHLGFGFLSLGLFLNLREKFSRSKFLILFISLLFFILPRPQYLPFFMLLLLVFNFDLKYKIIVAIGFLLSLLFGGGLYYQKVRLLTLGTRAWPQLLYLKLFPLKFITVLFNSYTNHIESYYKSLIGTFGSIHFYLDWYIYAFYGLFILMIFFHYVKLNWMLHLRELIVIILAIISTTFVIFFSMYLYESPIAFPYVVDVQGRYFIIILSYLLLVIVQIYKKFGSKLIYLSLILTSIFLLKNAYDRYFDYSQAYYYDFTVLKSNKQAVKNKVWKKININPNKKFLGLHFIIDKKNPSLTGWPILIIFYEKNCKVEVRKAIAVSLVENQEYRDAIFDRPMDGMMTICYSLEPIEGKKFSGEESFYILSEGLPIYAF